LLDGHVGQLAERVGHAEPIAEPAPDRQAALVECACGRILALQERDHPEVAGRIRDPLLVAKLLVDGQFLLVAQSGQGIVAPVQRHEAQVAQRVRHALTVAQGAPDGEALLNEGLRRLVIRRVAR